MTGLERNSDLVVMASYAPLLANVNGMQWQPDMIYFDSARAVFNTPSYYVQQLFSQNRGDAVLPATVSVQTNAAPSVMHGAIGLGSWNTSVQYTNIVVASNDVTLYQSDFGDDGTSGWNVFNGAWGVSNGMYQQTAIITDCYSTTGNTNWANYTLTLQARKAGGDEGFLILFNVLDDNDWTWWNIGGWSDTLDGIEQMVDGHKTTYAQVSQYIATDTWYDIRLVVTGARAQCYLGTNAAQAATNLVQDVTVPAIQSGGLLVSSTYANAAGQVIIKAVNAYTTPVATTFNITGVSSISSNATVLQLTSGSAADENSFSSPTYVFPVTNAISSAGTNFTLTLPANSLSVLRLHASGLNSYTNLMLQCASPISSGQLVASTVLGQMSGNWINLTANTNDAIAWSSANTNIAVVDINGHVTGVGLGTTSIIATYASLGLSATQAVQVIYVPAWLVHRYSFSEAPGSTTTFDSVGGAGWNGTLPNGGTFNGTGQLSISTTGSQYVNLPAGILSNYTALTIEGWVTATYLPVNCMYYAFGNTVGGTGYNYIFGSLVRDYTAISDGDYTAEQGAAGSVAPLSLNQVIHFTGVYNPPAGYIALYTNGVLAGINHAETDPLTDVSSLEAYLGRSVYGVDPYGSLTLDECRIYNGALNSAEIAATQALGPNQLLSAASPTFSAALSGTNLTLSWPLAAAGFTLESSTNLAANGWIAAPATPQIVGSQWQVTVPQCGHAQFFRLTQ